MSKLYELYRKKKNIDNNKYYLFKSGMFYIFIDEDAVNISKKTLLKLTKLNNDIVKCGFPKDKLDDYLELFNNLDINVEVVNSDNNIDYYSKVINKLKRIDIDKITPLESLNILNELVGIVRE